MPLLFLDMSSGELLLIVLAVMILFGPKRIPEIARTVGQTVGQLKAASDQIKREIMDEARSVEEGARKISHPVTTIIEEVDNNLTTSVLSDNSAVEANNIQNKTEKSVDSTGSSAS